MTRFRIVHKTQYTYGAQMADGFTITHLLPRATSRQIVHHAGITVTPEPDEWQQSTDVFGNTVVRFAVHHPHAQLLVESLLDVQVSIAEPQTTDVPWQTIRDDAQGLVGDLACDVAPFLAHTAQTPRLAELEALTSSIFVDGRGVVDAVSEFCAHIFETFHFDAGFSDVSTPLATVLTARRGVCQDFAHLTVAALRSIGLPARYISGYIETLPLPGQPRLIGADASHAWCSVWAGPCGWLDVDPTNNQMPPQRHVTVAWGRDYDDVAPVRGVVIGPPGGQTLTVSVDVAEQTG